MSGTRFHPISQNCRIEDFLIRDQEIREDIQLQKNTIEYWNRLHPEEEPISSDFSDIEAILDATMQKILAKSDGKKV